MDTKNKLNVLVERRFNASPERVFDAWLDPALIGRWMFGPAVHDEEISRLTVDARVGGSFSFVVRRQGEEINHVGRYLHMNRSRRLVFTWGIAGVSEDQSRVIVDVLPAGTGCELTLKHELQPQWADYAARMEAGWTAMLDALAATLDERQA